MATAFVSGCLGFSLLPVGALRNSEDAESAGNLVSLEAVDLAGHQRMLPSVQLTWFAEMFKCVICVSAKST